MTTLQTFNACEKTKEMTNFGKAIWLFFAKAIKKPKEPSRPKPTHHPKLFLKHFLTL